MTETWVVNASPLIFLGNAGHLDLLRDVAKGNVVVPAAVVAEVTTGPHADRATSALETAGWLTRIDALAVPEQVIEWDLGPGESAVIAAALTMASSRAVLDDLSGRKCALAMGVRVVGTLGIVINAQRRGLIKDARATIDELRSAGMWLSDSALARALRIAGIDP